MQNNLGYKNSRMFIVVDIIGIIRIIFYQGHVKMARDSYKEQRTV